MTTKLLIARHGNTFEPGEVPRRVGSRTNIPLTEEGITQARAIGSYLKENDLLPDAVFSAHLSRSLDTARFALIEAGTAPLIQEDSMFNEIDYGPDENKTEDEIVSRIGEAALKSWNKNAVPPDGWDINPEEIIKDWKDFGNRIVNNYPDCKIMVVTSNGIARFAPHLTGSFDEFAEQHEIKIATGALCCLEHDGESWKVSAWNVKP